MDTPTLSAAAHRHDPAHTNAPGVSGRARTLLAAAVAGALLLALVTAAALLPEAGLATQLESRLLPPSAAHPFGTDALGRDMLARSLRGLVVSLRVGLVAGALAAALALLLGLLAALSRRADAVVSTLIDLALALPHLVLLIIVSFALGGGVFGVTVAVIVSHWPALARVVRSEMREVLAADYVALARGLGSAPAAIARRHVLPHVLSRALVGAVLLVPHAILHEAGLSFLGFGIEPHLPATGTLLAEAMRHVSAGHWWLGVLPGAGLLVMVLSFERLAAGLALWIGPRRAQL
jgi:peptide/nickel transport system permease protein